MLNHSFALCPFVFFFNGRSTFLGYFMPKLSLQNHSDTPLLGEEKVPTFPHDISSKVELIARMGFELTYYNVAVQLVSHYAMGNSPHSFWHNIFLKIFILFLLFYGCSFLTRRKKL